MAERMTVTFEDADLTFKNFSARATKFKKEGEERSFNVFIPSEEIAQAMKADGWKVNWLPSKEEDEPDRPMIKVKVGFEYYPPTIWLITSTARTRIDEDTVGMLDSVSIKTVDLIIRSYHYSGTNGEGISAYLKTMYVTIEEDELELKYAQMEAGA